MEKLIWKLHRVLENYNPFLCRENAKDRDVLAKVTSPLKGNIWYYEKPLETLDLP